MDGVTAVDGVMMADGVMVDMSLLAVRVMAVDGVVDMAAADSLIQGTVADTIAADPSGHRISPTQSCNVNSMPTPLLALRDSSFPMADCSPCGKSVLTYVALDEDRRRTPHLRALRHSYCRKSQVGLARRARAGGLLFRSATCGRRKGRMQHGLWHLQRQEELSAPVWRSASYTTIETALERFRLRTPASKIGIR